MSEDLYDPYGEDILGEGEEEPEEELSEEEGQNKTFMIAVAALGGLLVLAIVLFGVWAFVINPKMQQAATVPPATETAVAVMDGTLTPQVTDEAAANVTGRTESEGATLTVSPEAGTKPPATPTPRPTSTPRPTNTPVIGATNTPTPVSTHEDEGAAASSVSEATATPTLPPRRTPTATPRPTATATPAPTRTPRVTHATDVTTPSVTPNTGWGELLLLAAALGLLGVLFIARRLRKVD